MTNPPDIPLVSPNTPIPASNGNAQLISTKDCHACDGPSLIDFAQTLVGFKGVVLEQLGDVIAKQPLFDKDQSTFLRLVLIDGTAHWVTFLQDREEDPLVAALCIHPPTNLAYTLVVSRDQVARLEELPMAIVAQNTPQEDRPPAGFASHPLVMAGRGRTQTLDDQPAEAATAPADRTARS